MGRWERLLESRPGRRLRRMHAEDPVLLRVRAALALLGLLLVARLAFGDDPWTGGIAERLRDGEPVRPVDYARTWGWWTAAALTPAVLAALVWAPRWLVRDAPPQVGTLAPPRRVRPALLAAALGAVLAGAWLAAPRLSQGLFEDERYNVMWSIDGFYLPPEEIGGPVRFHEPRWEDALWHYEWPNNHVPHTLLARLSVAAWRVVAQPESRLVSEAALRVPAFLAGLGSIAAIAAALWRLGHPGAAAAAAWLLALHPWHLRYASEARGYSLVLMGISVSVFALAAVLHRGTWRRWCGYGALQLLLLWTYPAALWFVLVLNAVALVSLVTLHRRRPAALRAQVVRQAAVGVAGALAWIFLMAPNLAQFAEYVETPSNEALDARWYQDVGAFLLAGTAWGRPRAMDHYTELSDLAMAAPAEVWGAVAVASGLALLGTARWLLAGGLRRRLTVLLLAPPVLLVGWAAWSNAVFHAHYMLLALPPLAMLVGVGIETALRPLGRGPGVAVGAALLVAFAALTQGPRSELRSRAVQPWRDAVALTRPVLDPAAPANTRILTASYSFPPQYYDPRVVRLGRARHLQGLMAEADARGWPLFINLGRPGVAQRRHPGLAEIVLGDRFEEVAFLPGILSRGQRQVFRYRGAAAAPAPSAAPADARR